MYHEEVEALEQLPGKEMLSARWEPKMNAKSRRIGSHWRAVAGQLGAVEQEMRNNAWINVLCNKITTAIQLKEYVALWILLQDVSLQYEMQDIITWRWTAMVSTPHARHITYNSKDPTKCNSDLI